MQVAKYRHRKDTLEASNILLCEACNPIIFQVFRSDFVDGVLNHEDAQWDEWDFTNNERGELNREIKEDKAEEDAYYERMDEYYSATRIETRNIREIERDLINLVPATADISWQYAGIYDDLKRGHEYFHQHEFDKAIEHYKAAAARQFNDVFFFCLALSYYLSGDYSNAIAAANPYNGKRIELPTLSRGWNAFILDTTPIDDLNYLLERRLELLQLKIAS